MVKYVDIFRIVGPRKYEGIYKNRGDNEFVSLRIRQGKGRDPSKWYSFQFRKLSEIVSKYGNNEIQLTTRGDIEIYRINYKIVDEVILELAKVDLYPRDSCGTVVRNIIPCPSNICPLAKIDAEDLSYFLADYFRFKKDYETLPKRFKISISACERGCSSPATMDIAVIAETKDKFEIRIGGGIGEHAFSSQKILEVDKSMLLPIFIAAIELLKKEGEKRGFKWIVKKYGIHKVSEMLLDEANKIKNSLPVPSDYSPKYLNTDYVRIRIPTGWISVEQLNKISDIMDLYGLGFGILFSRQTIDIPYKACKEKIIENLTNFDITFKDKSDPYYEEENYSNVVSCIGNDFCPPALINTRKMGIDAYNTIKTSKVPKGFRINFSGCTHSCGMHWIADLGFGAFANAGKTRLNIVLGGDPTKEIGKIIGTIDPKDYNNVIIEIIKMYNEIGREMTFKEFLTRVGEEKIIERLSKSISSFEITNDFLRSMFH